MLFTYAKAEYIYNPFFTDTFLKEQTHWQLDVAAEEAVGKDVFVAHPVIDIQTLKDIEYTPSIYLLVIILLFLFVVLKVKYTNFFESGLSALSNEKVFLLHMRVKRFAENFPWLTFFFMRIAMIALIIQYSIYFFTRNTFFTSLQYFAFWFALVAAFYITRLLAEWLVQAVTGNSGWYKLYYLQHILISVWLMLPVLLVVLLSSIYSDFITLKLFLWLTLLPLGIAFFFSGIRSLLLWRDGWRDYLLYFFIYFCTFKILPYALAIKWVSSNWSVFH